MNMKLMNTWLREVSSVKNEVDELIAESVLWFSQIRLIKRNAKAKVWEVLDMVEARRMVHGKDALE